MENKKNRISKTKVSFLTLILSCLFASSATFLIIKINRYNKPAEKIPVEAECSDKMSQTRLKNFQFIQPLILADLNAESSSLKNMRLKLENYINAAVKNQKVDEVSVYFRRLNDGSWFCINPNETYNPADMNKIIYLISILKEAQSNPSFLNKQIYFKHHYDESDIPKYTNFTLKEYSTYKVNDLLEYMAKYSDNDAAYLLTQQMNLNFYWQLFKDIDEPVPVDYGRYSITAAQFSKFFRLLYNASYITPELSEYGLKILTESTFKEGLCGGIDSTITVSHKYGEREIGHEIQLHEYGIVYVDRDPYLIGVMTKGSSIKELKTIIKEISRLSYIDFAVLHNS